MRKERYDANLKTNLCGKDETDTNNLELSSRTVTNESNWLIKGCGSQTFLPDSPP